MQYQTQSALTTRIKNRLNDRTTVTFPWTDDEVREAIQQAIESCYPLGDQAVVTMSKADYDANPQKISIDDATSAEPDEPGVLHVRQLEVINSSNQPTLLYPGAHYLVSPHGAKFLRVFQPMASGESLRMDAILGVAALDGTSGDDAVVVRLEPMLVVLYSCHYLLTMQSRQGTVSQRQDDTIMAEGYLAQAEQRKQFLIAQQYTSPMAAFDMAMAGGKGKK